MTIYRSRFATSICPALSVTEFILPGLAARGDQPSLIDGATGRALTGTMLALMIRQLAGGLTARGYGPGRVVALMAPNSPDYAAIFHGVAFAGGTITTVNPAYTAAELRFQLIDSRADLLITVPALLDTARAAIAGTGVRRIALIGTDLPGGPDLISLDDLLGPAQMAQTPVDLVAHTVVLPYSSGTTGLPKGVMLSHANLVANLGQFAGVVPIHPGDATIAVLPFFHIYGMNAVMNPYLSRQGLLVTMPRFDLELFLKLAQQHRVARLLVVPPIVLALTRHPLVAAHDLSAVTQIFSAAAPMGAETGLACAARLGCEVMQGYGMTEASPVTHATAPGQSRPGSVGLVLPDTECRIIDTETGVDAVAGAVGEVWVRGPQVMQGYLNNPEATARTIDADGWLQTGDVGRIDADGYLFIIDRVKELIKYKGFQVAPAELEALLLTHADVADAAVVGQADAEAGEVPVAFVVRSGGDGVDAAALQAHVAAHVASYKQIRRVIFVDSIPKSASGKILRRLLRAGL